MFLLDLLCNLDTSENVSSEGKINGHQKASTEKKSDESDADNQPGNGHGKESTNGNNNKEQELNEQAAMAATAAISGDSNKQTTAATESDTTSRRKF